MKPPVSIPLKWCIEMIYLTDFNFKRVLPMISTIQLASMCEDMPYREWMRIEIQKRRKREYVPADWFYHYLLKCPEPKPEKVRFL